MMSSLVSQDAETGSQHSAAGSNNPVLLSSGTFRPFSPSRRLFCLLTAFDFLASLFIWILYAHVSIDFLFLQWKLSSFMKCRSLHCFSAELCTSRLKMCTNTDRIHDLRDCSWDFFVPRKSASVLCYGRHIAHRCDGSPFPFPPSCFFFLSWVSFNLYIGSV